MSKFQQIKIGCYRLEGIQVDLYMMEGTGGEFYLSPENGFLPRIKVGADTTWGMLVSTLVHESLEFHLHMANCAYSPEQNDGNGSDRFVFWLNHYNLSVACVEVGEFLVAVLPDLASVYKQWHKKGKK